jgi:SAM-dependent methyltransferase
MDSAACSRSRVRQRPNGTPASAANARARVRSLAPTSRPHSRSVRRSAGLARNASATRRAVTASGSLTWIVVTGTGVSRSASSASACARRAASRPGSPRYPMSSASSGLAATGVGRPVSSQPTRNSPGLMYSERMVARPPSAAVSCGSPAGIHSALVGGSTQVDSAVSTVSTPLAAQASWWSSWVCQSNRVPGGMGKSATKTAAPLSGRQSGDCPARDTTWQLTCCFPAGWGPSVGAMNENHAKLMPSPEWAAHIQDEVLPQATAGVELGADLLELGPGPGAATEWLRHRVNRLVAVEHEEEAAARLAARFAGTNVEVVRGDAAALGYPDAAFDTIATCTMLHHVPTRTLQDKVLAEAFRVLRPGGTFLGSDSLPSDDLHQFHEGDTYNPVEPAAFLTRLQTTGFAAITLHVSYNLVFTARKAEDSP